MLRREPPRKPHGVLLIAGLRLIPGWDSVHDQRGIRHISVSNEWQRNDTGAYSFPPHASRLTPAGRLSVRNLEYPSTIVG